MVKLEMNTFVFEAADNMTNLVFGGNETTDNGSLDMVDYTRPAIKGMTIDLGGKVGFKASDEANLLIDKFIDTYDNNGFAYSAVPRV